MMAVVRVDAKLADYLERILTPVFDVDERVVERRPIITGETVSFAQGPGCRENIRRDDLIHETREFGISQADAIESFELLPEICFKRRSVANVLPKRVLQAMQLREKCLFEMPFRRDHRH